MTGYWEVAPTGSRPTNLRTSRLLMTGINGVGASWPPTTAGPSPRAHHSPLGEGRSRLAQNRFGTDRADLTLGDYTSR